jgi:hypothetical protein
MAGPLVAQAQTAPFLGTAASFGVLAGSTVTNTGPTTVAANLGVSPGSAVTGFGPGLLTVTDAAIHTADGVALQAQSDVTTAYTTLAGEQCPGQATAKELGGKTLVAGVYCFASEAGLTGELTLDGQGNSAARFVFQIPSTLITASDARVTLIGGATGCNVYWQVGSSATLGTRTAFVGNILALTSIGLETGATIVPGRALARNGAVTLDTNRISPAVCNGATEEVGGLPVDTGPVTGGSPPDTSATPELDSVVLFGSGIAGLGSYVLMRARARRKSSIE